MKAKYIQQVTNLNYAAKTFAVRGYHVTTSFFSSRDDMSVVIYFHKIDDKSVIERTLQPYIEENDEIHFDELKKDDGSKFYTLKLIKHSS